MKSPRIPRQIAILLAVAGVSASAGALTSDAAGKSGWNWFSGDERAHVGGASNTDSLELFSAGDTNVSAGHIRIVGRDGNFEFEHDKSVATATLNAYFAGTPTRTPISIGGWDTQDIVSLINGGQTGQTSDLQQWQTSGKTVAAVTRDGALKLKGITLSLALQSGKVVLAATLSDGSQQRLAIGVPIAQRATEAESAKRK